MADEIAAAIETVHGTQYSVGSVADLIGRLFSLLNPLRVMKISDWVSTYLHWSSVHYLPSAVFLLF